MDNTERLKVLKAAARISDFGYGEWIYDLWAEFNEQYFDGILEVGGIFWGLTPHGHALGSYDCWRNAITLHVSLVKASGDAWGLGTLLGKRFAGDVLLHEMIHQFNEQVDKLGNSKHKSNETSHNCDAWCNQINRLIPLLNIETSLKAVPIKQKRISKQVQWYTPPGAMSRKQLGSFPHCLRPRSYYEAEALALVEKTGLLEVA